MLLNCVVLCFVVVIIVVDSPCGDFSCVMLSFYLVFVAACEVGQNRGHSWKENVVFFMSVILFFIVKCVLVIL